MASPVVKAAWRGHSLAVGFAASFVAVGGLFVAIHLVSAHRAVGVRSELRQVTANAIRSVELLSRIRRDLYREHLLIDEHIFAEERAAMERIEARIAETRADYNTAAREYRTLSTFAGEVDGWSKVQDDVGAMQEPIAAALALSRANKDEEAHARLPVIDARFAAVEDDVERLVRIDQDAATWAQARILKLQETQQRFRTALMALGVALTAGLGIVVCRAAGRWQRQERQHALDLEARNHDLDAFAGRVAHDLRGPLGNIRLVASRLRLPDADIGMVRERLDRAVGRMDRLIHDLLALAQIDGEELGGECDVLGVVAMVHDEVKERTEGAGATLHLDVEPASLRCLEGLLVQALVNLVDNALKYHRPGVRPAIELTGRRVDGRYEVRVADNGIGMSPDEADRAFEPFFRAGRVAEQGTGLGLPICRGFIEAMGGRIVAANRSDRSGAVFTVSLASAPAIRRDVAA